MTKHQQNKLKGVRQIATQLSFLTIVKKSGLSPGKIGKIFKKSPCQTAKQYWEDHSGVMYKYARGDICIKDNILINNIDKDLRFSGFKKNLTHPLWDILETPSASLEEVESMMRKLNPAIQGQLFRFDKQKGEFKRKYPRFTDTYSRICMQNNLDALACFLMLIRELELKGKWHSYTMVKWYTHNLVIYLSYFQPFSDITNDFYTHIFEKFIGKNNPLDLNIFNSDTIKLFQGYFIAPRYIDNFSYLHIDLEELLIKASTLGIKISTHDQILKCLFWAFEFGVLKILEAMGEYESTGAFSIPLKRFVEANNNSNTRKYLSHYSILDIATKN